MKKFLFSLAAAAFAITATAAEPTIIDNCAYLQLMPPIVTAKGESYIIADGSNKIRIYDKNLENKATITLPKKEVVVLKYWYEYLNKENGSWGEREEYTRLESMYNCTRMYLDFIGADANPYSATQTFFNNDSKFEYIVPKCKIVEYCHEGDEQRYGEQNLIITAFEIKSQDGSTLMTLTIPEEYQSYPGVDPYITGIIIDDKKYVKTNFDLYNEDGNLDERPYACLFYEIDGTSGIKAPAMVMEGAMTVHPTLPRRGETVTVDLGAAAQPGCRIAVTAVNGRNALNLQAKAGETSVNIPTASLAAGMYVVTVNNGTTATTEAAKIIIR